MLSYICYNSCQKCGKFFIEKEYDSKYEILFGTLCILIMIFPFQYLLIGKIFWKRFFENKLQVHLSHSLLTVMPAEVLRMHPIKRLTIRDTSVGDSVRDLHGILQLLGPRAFKSLEYIDMSGRSIVILKFIGRFKNIC